MHGEFESARKQRETVKRGGGGDWLDAFGARVGWRNEKVRCALQDLILLHVIHWPWASSGSEVDISSQGTSATPLARRARAVRSARMAMSSLPAGPKAKLIGDVQNRTALKNVKARRFYVKCGKLQISPLLTTRTPVPDYVLNFSCVYTLRITHTDQLLQPNLF